jgi:hypothetical protein
MHQNVTASVTASPERVAEIIGDLGTYPEWLGLVVDAVPVSDDGGRPAWSVTIRAEVGPFARSKKLRMVRTTDETSDGVDRFRFERSETDERNHSAWTLEATVAAGPTGTAVTMDLRYEGRLWTAPLEPVLGSFIDDAGPGLEAYAAANP